jgi:hypothetical protein
MAVKGNGGLFRSSSSSSPTSPIVAGLAVGISIMVVLITQILPMAGVSTWQNMVGTGNVALFGVSLRWERLVGCLKNRVVGGGR